MLKYNTIKNDFFIFFASLWSLSFPHLYFVPPVYKMQTNFYHSIRWIMVYFVTHLFNSQHLSSPQWSLPPFQRGLDSHLRCGNTDTDKSVQKKKVYANIRYTKCYYFFFFQWMKWLLAHLSTCPTSTSLALGGVGWCCLEVKAGSHPRQITCLSRGAKASALTLTFMDSFHSA